MERFLGPDMDLHPEQLLEILNQPGMIQQTPARLPRYQEIEVAVLIGFTAGHRAEHAQAVGAAPLREPEDSFADLYEENEMEPQGEARPRRGRPPKNRSGAQA